ncbi:MAG: hypothetical protein JEY99_13780 [Spirochaetales bacterium]|nr:hypothetical protein [Spirochaetales bacterium]
MIDAKDIFIHQLCHLIAISLTIWINCRLLLRTQKSLLLKRYKILQACLLIWMTCKVLKTIAPSLSLRWLFVVIQYSGISFIGVSFFHFVFYLIFRRDPRRGIRYTLLLLSALTFIFVITNPLHSLFYSTFDFYGDTFGPLFYWNALIIYVMIFSGITMLIYGMIKRRSIARQEQLLTLAALFPLLFNILYVTGILEPVFDYTPIAIAISLFFLSSATFRHHFLGVLPMAYNTIIMELEDPIIIKDSYDHTLYGDRNLADRIKDLDVNNIFSHEKQEYLLVNKTRKNDKTLYHLSDISRIRRLQREQAATNEKLKKIARQIQENNKNRVALAATEMTNNARRELHDLLGHTLTQVILLLQSSKSLLDNNSTKALQPVVQATEICRKCLDDTDNIENHINKNRDNLSESLYRLVESYASINLSIEFTMIGTVPFLSPDLSRTLYRCCQEGITNAVKHGKASRVELILQFKNDKLILLIADEGTGTDDKTKGEGLTMMADRLKEFKGTVRHESSPGQGFLLSITCPVKTS